MTYCWRHSFPPFPPPSFRCRQPFLIFFVVEGRL